MLIATSRSALVEELALCATLLELDGRNFHCWAHRMWVAERMNLSAEDDFDFTTTKIKQAGCFVFADFLNFFAMLLLLVVL